MKQTPFRPTAATSEFLLPQPNAEDVAKMRDLYRRRTGKDITDDQAREALSRIVRFQYLNILINAPCPGTDSMPESPTTTGG